MEGFTHFNEQGRANMVDISEKCETSRTAVAFSRVKMNDSVWEAVREGKMKKGDVLSVAQVAGIMGGKKTSDIIPMCHPLMLSKLNIEFEMPETGIIDIYVTVKTKGSTGVEMEALTAASVTGLTIYDMCKAMDKGIELGPTYLLEKEGGKSGYFKR
ncbi:cyclic pyranopterin monophosphate synthase MoaC [Salinibacillus xinjiangensis]|uniref:Cyclic pyranopterin monophosphate synthase n=1 Tax=Salinibacillus xinjiangensis TaxID=1229268 RepID=A0A6G1X3W8_9BACI|nr:cyclic pyranopterin monophosphate synthase MoaC [Salinibacillus xinjiangensis]MRG85654.1 cyclic pyranopterin monophosphate synthase MoaC [Salinibacillus xinjiangensis]